RYDAFADHLALCAPLLVANFQPAELPNVSADAALKEVSELATFQASSIAATAGNVTAQLKTYGRIISISRQIIINDDIGLLDNVFASFGSSATRIDIRHILNCVEATPCFQDAEPL